MYRKNNTKIPTINLISNSLNSTYDLNSNIDNIDKITYSNNYSQVYNVICDTISQEKNVGFVEDISGQTIKKNIENYSIPVGILKNSSSLEAIVLYLKDVLGIKFVDISKLLNRDQRTIWVTYSKAKKKSSSKILNSSKNNFSKLNFSKFVEHKEISSLNQYFTITIPLDIFSTRKYSVLESIVLYLKETYSLSFNQISEILGKNYRTIWTIYRRAIKKLDGGFSATI